MHIKCLWKLEEDYNSGFEILLNDSSLLIGRLKVSSEKFLLSLQQFLFLQHTPWDPCIKPVSAAMLKKKPHQKLNQTKN